MKNNKLLIAAFTLFGMMSFNNAFAKIITFNDLAGTNMPGATVVSPGLYTEFYDGVTATINGYDFTVTPGGYSQYIMSSAWGGGDNTEIAWNGTDYQIISGLTDGLNINQANGGAFSLNSLDMANWDDTIPGIYISVTGNFMNGGSINEKIPVSNLLNSVMQDGNDFTHYTFTGFNNLSSLNISYYGNYKLAIDNINVSAVPEPEFYAMLLAGLGLLGSMARRRKESIV